MKEMREIEIKIETERKEVRNEQREEEKNFKRIKKKKPYCDLQCLNYLLSGPLYKSLPIYFRE